MITALLLMIVTTMVPGAPQAASATPEAAVRAVVAKYLEARDHRDAKAVGDLFTEDADQLTSSGDWRKGREEIVRGTLASSDRTGGTRTITIQSVRFPAKDLAIADGRYELNNAQERRLMWTSLVMVQQAGEWRISAIRNMLPAAQPASK
jgi:uncharacterized protein (TIGR02246 family)